ncbi:MAG: oligoendopeptidase F [Lachnospiraceae bacterium]|nr:oligoendopeptidase F [Lachnospiraceae bacterium]
MDASKVLKRDQVPKEFTWDLSMIFENDEAWLEAFEAMKPFPAKLRAYEGRLGESAETLLSFEKLTDEVRLKMEKIYGYASLSADQDTADSKYQDFRGRAASLYAMVMGSLAFQAPEIISIPEEKLEAFYQEKPELLTYKRSIDVIRRRAAHTLSEKEETLLSNAAEITRAPQGINSLLHNADMKWAEVSDSKGNVYPLSNGSFTNLLESPDRDLREKVFKAYYQGIDAMKNTTAACLDGQFKGLVFYADARGYKSTLEASLDETEVPVKVYHNLIQAVHENLESMYRYVRVRKKLLGVDELHMYDVYTPIIPDVAKKISYDEAKATVLKALSVLGEDYTDLLREGFENRWIDVYENIGKRSGAYSSGISHPHPYVLLNFKDNLDSMFTLAHEMGHSLHSWHSTKHQPVNTADYVIFVAEVASTVNEVLLMKYLLKNCTDKAERAYLVNHFLDSFKGTVYRQTMFAEFELMLGKMAEERRTLTADALCEKYLELNKLYFGPDMVSDPEIALEWARIPHFFYDYYVFQYATGFSAACAIADRILTEGAPAVADYKKFLSGGSSKDPISLLRIAGVDMETPDAVNAGLKLFAELVTEMEQYC